MSSGNIRLMEEQAVLSSICIFRTLVIVFIIKTAQGATKMFELDIHGREKSVFDQTPHRTRGVLSEHVLFVPPKAGVFRDDVTVYIFTEQENENFVYVNSTSILFKQEVRNNS